MSKELRALERIETFLKENCKHYKQDVGYIKQALLKAQENEKELDDNLTFENGKIMSGFNYKGKQIVAMPLSEFNGFMEQDQILSIIKEKDVDIVELKSAKTVEDYNLQLCGGVSEPLTEEEFDLLKRWLG